MINRIFINYKNLQLGGSSSNTCFETEISKSDLSQQYWTNYHNKDNINNFNQFNINTIGSFRNYDDIKCSGMQQIVKYLDINSNDTFYDLGSGLGKVVFEVAKSNPNKSIGVEFNKELFDKSLELKNKFLLTNDHFDNIEFINNNVMDENFDDATKIFSAIVSNKNEGIIEEKNNSDEKSQLILSIQNKINNNNNIQKVLSMHELDLIGDWNKQNVNIDVSWSGGTQEMFLYSKN